MILKRDFERAEPIPLTTPTTPSEVFFSQAIIIFRTLILLTSADTRSTKKNVISFDFMHFNLRYSAHTHKHKCSA